MATFTVTTTLGPTYTVGEDEYEALLELGLIGSTGGVTVPAAKVIISTTSPPTPAVGQVWFNPSLP